MKAPKWIDELTTGNVPEMRKINDSYKYETINKLLTVILIALGNVFLVYLYIKR